MTRQRGIILIVVLWIVATLAVLVAVLNSTVNKSARLAQVEDRRLRTQAILDAGLETAAGRLLSENSGMRWHADGRTYESQVPGGLVRVQITDARGLIDINRADERLLVGLFLQFAPSREEAMALAKAIIAQRGPADAAAALEEDGTQTEAEPIADETEGENQDSNEQQEGSGGQPAGEASGHRFMSLTQLYSLPGAGREFVSTVMPFLTVYSANGRIKPGAAPREVLASLPDISPQEVESLLKARAGGRLDGSDARAILAKFEQFVLAEDDKAKPIYVVRVEAHGHRVLTGSQAETTIIPGAGDDRPYHVLARSW